MYWSNTKPKPKREIYKAYYLTFYIFFLSILVSFHFWQSLDFSLFHDDGGRKKRNQIASCKIAHRNQEHTFTGLKEFSSSFILRLFPRFSHRFDCHRWKSHNFFMSCAKYKYFSMANCQKLGSKFIINQHFSINKMVFLFTEKSNLLPLNCKIYFLIIPGYEKYLPFASTNVALFFKFVE